MHTIAPSQSPFSAGIANALIQLRRIQLHIRVLCHACVCECVYKCAQMHVFIHYSNIYVRFTFRALDVPIQQLVPQLSTVHRMLLLHCRSLINSFFDRVPKRALLTPLNMYCKGLYDVPGTTTRTLASDRLHSRSRTEAFLTGITGR